MNISSRVSKCTILSVSILTWIAEKQTNKKAGAKLRPSGLPYFTPAEVLYSQFCRFRNNSCESTSEQ